MRRNIGIRVSISTLITFLFVSVAGAKDLTPSLRKASAGRSLALSGRAVAGKEIIRKSIVTTDALISPASGLLTTERGHAASFNVALTARPAEDVTIQLSSSDLTEGTVSPSSLTFTPEDWGLPQRVVVTGQADGLADGDVAYSIQGVVSSADPQSVFDFPAVSAVNAGSGADTDQDSVPDATDLDDDGDSVADLVEQAAPNGGDGNFDGVPDDLQARVASLRTATDLSFLTLEVTSPGCSQGFSSVDTMSESMVVEDPDFAYPYGLFHFELPDCESAQMAVWHHRDADFSTPYSGWAYRTQDIAGDLDEIGGAEWDALSGWLRVTLNLEDDSEDGDLEISGGVGMPASPAGCQSASVHLPEILWGPAGAESPAQPRIAGQQTYREISQNLDGSKVVEFVVTLENVSPEAQPDNPGPEFVSFLPVCAEVDLGSLTTTSGSVTVVGAEGQATALEWNGELAGASLAKTTGGGSTTTTTTTVKVTVTDLPIQGLTLQPDPEPVPW